MNFCFVLCCGAADGSYQPSFADKGFHFACDAVQLSFVPVVGDCVEIRDESDLGRGFVVADALLGGVHEVLPHVGSGDGDATVHIRSTLRKVGQSAPRSSDVDKRSMLGVWSSVRG